MRLTERPGGIGDRVSDTFAWYIGIDWGSEQHHLCLLDANGQVCGERTVAHTAEAVHAALQWVREQTGVAPEAVAVGLETPRGVRPPARGLGRCASGRPRRAPRRGPLSSGKMGATLPSNLCTDYAEQRF